MRRLAVVAPTITPAMSGISATPELLALSLSTVSK